MLDKVTPGNVITTVVVILGLLGGMYVMGKIDDFRIGLLETQLLDLESYVAALEHRERDLLQRVTVLEVLVDKR